MAIISSVPTIRAAAVQAEPVVLDRDATVVKACSLISEAATNGANLIVFPELFVPTYVHGAVWGKGFGGWSPHAQKAWLRLWNNSVEIPSATTDQLGQAARDAQAIVVIGVNEREPDSKTLYNTLLFIGSDGAVLGKHRKLMPTNHERMFHGLGDGSTLKVYDTPIGKLGGLICWENWMPLARYALYSQGEQIHVAPTAFDGELTITNIRNTAFEGGVFVISVCEVLKKSSYPNDFELADELASASDVLHIGGSAIVGPDTEILAGPLWNEEGILYADLDLTKVVEHGRFMDTNGHYSRGDILRLHLNSKPQSNIEISGY